jgi:hypothetical protein
LLVGRYPFLGDVFPVDFDLVAPLKVAKRLYRTRFLLVKPPNLGIKRAHTYVPSGFVIKNQTAIIAQ